MIRNDIAWERPHLNLSKPFIKPDINHITCSKWWQDTENGADTTKAYSGNTLTQSKIIGDFNVNNMINVALGKQATQSSQSKWSKHNDANRAVEDIDISDYAFHTEFEMSPWWKLDLGKCFLVDSIIVKNRKKGFQNRARTIALHTSIDGENWICIHKGILYWKDSLNFQLDGELPVRFIKISLEEKQHLHLLGIEVWVSEDKIYIGDNKKIVAQRADGLGERMNAIINGLVLSNILGVKFRFHWSTKLVDDKNHAIEPVQEIFSQNFIDKYLIDKIENETWELSGPNLGFSNLCKKLDEFDCLLSPRLDLKEIFDLRVINKESINYIKSFESIEFSTKISKAIALARSINLPSRSVALHLRSGDVFFGPYRKYVHYTYKGITAPVVKALIEKLSKEGLCVYLFGQDTNLISLFCNEFSDCVINGNSLKIDETNHMGRLEKAFFDLILLSRFPEIIAGSSGFAKQASWIGGARLKYPKDFLTADEQLNYSISDLSKNVDTYHPLQVAFSYWYVFFINRRRISNQNKIDLLKYAWMYDKDNELYPLVIASIFFDEFKFEQGESILQELFLNRLGDLNEIFRVFEAKTLGKFNVAEFHKSYISAVENSCFFARCLICYLNKSEFNIDIELVNCLVKNYRTELIIVKEVLAHLSGKGLIKSTPEAVLAMKSEGISQ